MREARIQNELEEIRGLAWAQVIQCSPKGIEREDYWIVWVPGKKGTLWQGGTYPVTISFPAEYPRVGPNIKFQSDFKHVHVYQGGEICLPLIESSYWRAKTNMADILQRIVSLIHQDVNQYSPANVDFFTMLKENPGKYEEFIKSQAQRYSKQSEKYFHEPSIHINMICE